MPLSSYNQTNTVTNTVTHEVTHTYGVSAGFDLSVAGIGLKADSSLEWTDTQTSVSVNASTQSATVSVGGPAFGYTGPVDVLVYWDTIYNSFMFAFQAVAASLSGISKNSRGQPVAHQEVEVAAGGHTFTTFTDAKGQYRFYGAPAGAAVSAVLQKRQITDTGILKGGIVTKLGKT